MATKNRKSDANLEFVLFLQVTLRVRRDHSPIVPEAPNRTADRREYP
jgi:hypothetical protein